MTLDRAVTEGVAVAPRNPLSDQHINFVNGKTKLLFGQKGCFMNI